MADVFLSYSSKDRAAAERVQQALSARGIDVFWDQETPTGQDWDTWIRGKLSACKVAVVLWSRSSVKSDNVRHEALVARKANKLLPAMIDPVEPEDLPMGLYMVQATNLADWRDPASKGVARLVGEIEARLGRRSAAPPQQAGKPAPARSSNRAVGPIIGGIVLAGVFAAIGYVIVTNAFNMLSSEKPDLPADRFSGNQVFTPGDGTSSPASDSQKFSQRMVGSWAWGDKGCEDSSRVSIDQEGRLAFRTAGTLFVHAIENDLPTETTTRVVDCGSCDQQGNAYRLSASGELAVIENVTRGTIDTWTRCP